MRAVVIHIWTGLEAICPQVQTEFSFRIALYLANCRALQETGQYFFERARRSYQEDHELPMGGNLKKRDGYDPGMSLAPTTRNSSWIIKREKVPSEGGPSERTLTYR